jgi:8-oxo-dGTP pyrophosphatase MutT (NUDIX family)
MLIKRRHIPQSAVIPYRRRRKNTEVLLVTSLGSGRWVFPKGHIEGNLSARQSAEKEAFEEAGVGGRLSPNQIGYYYYCKKHKNNTQTYQVEVFAMKVTDVLESWPEEYTRQREWMSPENAADAVKEDNLRILIRHFFGGLNK